jgi:glycosyltransferase involved in cell wall biosynthesis
MSKIRIGYYVHNWDYAGTSQIFLNIVEVLDKNIFEPFAFYWDECLGNNKLYELKKYIGSDHTIPFKRSKEKTPAIEGYTPLWTNLNEVILDTSLDIFHVGRSGYYEWPFDKRLVKLQIETNIFGDRDNSGFVDKSICISNNASDIHGGCNWVMYNPIRSPVITNKNDNLRKILNIPDNALVCGRIGRPANFDPIAIEAFKKAQELQDNLYYIIMNPCQDVINASIGIKNVIFLPANLDELYVERFFNTLDLFLHYRFDGEMCGCAIQQAMIKGIPIISHRSKICNGHIEVVGDGGYIANNAYEYYNYLKKMILCPELRTLVGEKARKIAFDKFEQKALVKELESGGIV